MRRGSQAADFFFPWKVTGSFSRLDYMKGTAMLGDPSSGGPASFAEITEQIPRTAHTFYYRDAIGNVSTSQYVHKNNVILVQLGRCQVESGKAGLD